MPNAALTIVMKETVEQDGWIFAEGERVRAYQVSDGTVRPYTHDHIILYPSQFQIVPTVWETDDPYFKEYEQQIMSR
jgi:hypothetical protein